MQDKGLNGGQKKGSKGVGAIQAPPGDPWSCIRRSRTAGHRSEKFEEGGGCVDGEQQQPALADVGTPAKTVAPTAAHKGRRGIAGGSDCAATLASTGAAKPLPKHG